MADFRELEPAIGILVDMSFGFDHRLLFARRRVRTNTQTNTLQITVTAGCSGPIPRQGLPVYSNDPKSALFLFCFSAAKAWWFSGVRQCETESPVSTFPHYRAAEKQKGNYLEPACL